MSIVIAFIKFIVKILFIPFELVPIGGKVAVLLMMIVVPTKIALWLVVIELLLLFQLSIAMCECVEAIDLAFLL